MNPLKFDARGKESKRAQKYGDGLWLMDVTTPCVENPKLYDRINHTENMNPHRNPRLQEAQRTCAVGTARNPGRCPVLEQCRILGERIRGDAPGVYGGVYLSRTRDAWSKG